MTAPPPFDPAHPQVGPVPAWLSTGKHRTPQGEMLVLTIRVPNATITTVMSKADAQRWVDTLQAEVDGISSLTLAPPGSMIPPMGHNANGKPFG